MAADALHTITHGQGNNVEMNGDAYHLPKQWHCRGQRGCDQSKSHKKEPCNWQFMAGVQQSRLLGLHITLTVPIYEYLPIGLFFVGGYFCFHYDRTVERDKKSFDV